MVLHAAPMTTLFSLLAPRKQLTGIVVSFKFGKLISNAPQLWKGVTFP